MWAVGIVMMVALCFGGGFFMHKHAGGEAAPARTAKDAPRQVHGHGDAAGISAGDESKGAHQYLMQTEKQEVKENGVPTEVSGDGKEIAKESVIKDTK